MKRLLNIGLLLSSLLGYLEWGKDNHSFLFQVEYDLIFGTAGSTDSFLHPFILIPLLGQLALLVSAFQKKSNKALTLVGLCCLSLIMLFLFFIGLMSLNFRIALSACPFIVFSVLIVRQIVVERRRIA